jgi:hypothetical protein
MVAGKHQILANREFGSLSLPVRNRLESDIFVNISRMWRFGLLCEVPCGFLFVDVS